jgi:D-xylose transport system substrate-binding protein
VIPVPRRAAVSAATLALAVSGLAACGGESGGTGTEGAGGGGASGKIALLLPESKTTRYESFDRPLFESRVKELCADCEIVYSNADQDASKQQQQAESAITQGVKVMVLDPVDSAAAASVVNSAKSQGVPVVSYDRFIRSAPIDYYISFDNEKVGQLQGQALIDKLKEDGKSRGAIVMINGAPTDNNASQFKKGAHSVLDSSGFTIAAEYDTPDWSPDKAQSWMDGQLSQIDKASLAGVYAANDGTAGGAIAAMKAAGLDPLPPVTGQDAELTAIQRIVAGDQYMTVYKAIKPEAGKAAELAVALLKGEKPATDEKVEGIPSFLLEPVAVTADSIKDTVVADGFYKIEDICTGALAAKCGQLGLS